LGSRATDNIIETPQCTLAECYNFTKLKDEFKLAELPLYRFTFSLAELSKGDF